MSAPGRRVFLALWPCDAERDRLLDAIRPVSALIDGRAVPRQNLHLTLAFLGSLSPARIEAACEVAAATALDVEAPVGVTLDHLHHWVRSHLVCAVPSQDPLDVRNLARRLVVRLHAREFKLESRAFRAHVTIVRDVTGRVATQELQPVRWSFDEFCLIESVPGSAYRVLERWPLYK